jgi:hypothetical protein
LHTTARTHFGTRTTPPPFTHTSLSEELDPVGTLQLAPRRTAVTPASSKPLPATFGHLSHTAAQAFQLVVAFAREMEKCTAQRKHMQQPTALRQEPHTSTTAAHVGTIESPSRRNFVVPPVCLQTVSRPFELSLQSSLQLSLTVLVCYRFLGNI